jgi:hypothetical protein
MVGGFGDEGGEGESSIMTEVDGLLSASRRKKRHLKIMILEMKI